MFVANAAAYIVTLALIVLFARTPRRSVDPDLTAEPEAR